MAVTRKVSPKNMTPRPSVEEDVVKVDAVEVEAAETSEVREEGGKKGIAPKRACFFHKSNTEPAYWDATALRKFLNDRGRIYPRQRNGNCAKHQRRVAQAIKRARFLALLPYSAGI